MLELIYVELDHASNPHIIMFTCPERPGAYEFMPYMEAIKDHIETQMEIKFIQPNPHLAILRFVSRRDATVVKFTFEGTSISEWIHE